MSRNRRRQPPAPQPQDVNGQWNLRTLFYREQLGIIIKGQFKLKSPDDWDRDYMLDLLVYEGKFCITRSPAGVLPFRTGLSGENYMNMPTHCEIDVPCFPNMQRTIDDDCVLIYLQRMRTGYGFYTYRNLIDITAERLASADACIDVNLMNSRVAYIAEAETKAQAETIKAAYQQITNGEPLVVIRKGLADSKTISNGMQVFFNSVKNNFIADIVQDEKRSIINEFLTTLGVNNANTDKKERLITGEVDSNNDELAINIYHFKQNLKKQVKKVNAMFPDVDFKIKFKFDMSNKKKEQIYATLGASRPMGVSSSARKVHGQNGN